jgi:hypothetical protein
MKITPESLKALVDFEDEGARVKGVIEKAAADSAQLVRFMARYASWNGLFGSGVSSLAGKIGRSRSLFLEEGLPPAVSDRSVLVGSYFFDAARDEFDDRDTKHRDTHRCLAQATLLGFIDFARDVEKKPLFGDQAALGRLFDEPIWLVGLRQRVSIGYGLGSPDDYAAIFRSMGYHLGSEVLADQEFSVLDSTLRGTRKELADYLAAHTVTIAKQEHNSYQWIRIHSGHGGGAEADHFAWAVRGVHRAFDYTPESMHADLRDQIDEGYREFARDHREFFGKVLSDPLPG